MIGKARTGLALAVTAWALVVAVAAYASSHWGTATAPEQTTIAAALTDLGTAVGDLVAALDADHVLITVGGLRRAERPCRITAARAGSRYERVLEAFVPAGTESQLLRELAEELPDESEPHVTTWQNKPIVTARAGDFGKIRASVATAGQVRIRVDTGCRSGTLARFQPGTGAAPKAARDGAAEFVGLLGLRPAAWLANRAECRAAGQLWTVQASAPGPAASLAGVVAAVRSQPGTRVVLERADVVGVRSGATAIVVTKRAEGTTVAATAGCAR